MAARADGAGLWRNRRGPDRSIPAAGGARRDEPRDRAGEDGGRKADVRFFGAVPVHPFWCVDGRQDAAVMTPEELALYRKSTRGRAVAMGVVLGALARLFLAITIATVGCSYDANRSLHFEGQ